MVRRLNSFRAWVVGATALAASLLVLVETKPAQSPFPGENGKFPLASDPYFDGVSDVYVMNPDGSNPTNLTINTANDSDSAFSSDAKKVVFTSNRDGNKEIYVMSSDGSNQRRLTNNSASDSELAFSPDRSKIVFAS